MPVLLATEEKGHWGGGRKVEGSETFVLETSGALHTVVRLHSNGKC